MNPLNAQQISRIEHSHSFQKASRQESSKFFSATVKPFQFITTFFNATKKGHKNSLRKKLQRL